MNNAHLYNIAEAFAFDAPIVEITAHGQGFINDTYIVRTEKSRYILQRKNHNIFPDVPAMMSNIQRVTAHLKAKVKAAGGDSEREVLTVVPTKDGTLYYRDGDNFWAALLYIEDTTPISFLPLISQPCKQRKRSEIFVSRKQRKGIYN